MLLYKITILHEIMIFAAKSSVTTQALPLKRYNENEPKNKTHGQPNSTRVRADASRPHKTTCCDGYWCF